MVVITHQNKTAGNCFEPATLTYFYFSPQFARCLQHFANAIEPMKTVVKAFPVYSRKWFVSLESGDLLSVIVPISSNSEHYFLVVRAIPQEASSDMLQFFGPIT